MGGIEGTVVAGLGKIAGDTAPKKEKKKAKKNNKQQSRRNEDVNDRRYNEDATQRADAQRILTKTEESIRNRNRQAAGAQAVMGGTEESVAAAKAANNQALADATSQIAVNAEARKDQIEQTYQQRDAQIDDALNNLEIKKSEAISSAVQGVAQAGAGIAGAF